MLLRGWRETSVNPCKKPEMQPGPICSPGQGETRIRLKSPLDTSGQKAAEYLAWHQPKLCETVWCATLSQTTYMSVTHTCLLQVHGQTPLDWEVASRVGTRTAAVAICAGSPGVFSSISEILCGSSESFGRANRPAFLTPLPFHSSLFLLEHCMISNSEQELPNA